MKRLIIISAFTLASEMGFVTAPSSEADASASCLTHEWTIVVGGGLYEFHGASCVTILGTQARGVLDCRWLPDPKTGWISGVGSKYNWWHGCPFSNSRGARIDIR